MLPLAMAESMRWQAQTIEIRHAYFKKVRTCHPDKCINKSEEEKTECVLEYERVTQLDSCRPVVEWVLVWVCSTPPPTRP